MWTSAEPRAGIERSEAEQVGAAQSSQRRKMRTGQRDNQEASTHQCRGPRKKLIERQPSTMTERSHPLCGQRAPRRHPSKLRVPEVLKHTQSVVDPVDGPGRTLPCSIGAVPSRSWFSSKVEVGASLTRSEPKILAEPGGTP